MIRRARTSIRRSICSLALPLLFVVAGAAPAAAAGLFGGDDPLAALGEKNFVGAREAAHKVLAKKKDDKDALTALGWAEFSLGNYTAAREAFAKLERLDPKSADALLGLGWVHVKLVKYPEAEAYLKKADDRVETWQRYQVADTRGWMALHRGALQKAASLFAGAAGLLVSGRPEPDDPMVGLGWVALKRNDLAAARRRFREGLERNAFGCFYCYDGLARVALAEGKIDEALKHAVAGAQRARHNGGLVALVDALLLRKQDPARSIKVYKDLAKAHKQDALYVARLGWAQLAANDPKEARASFTRALKLAPEHPDAVAGLRQIKALDRRIVGEAWEYYARGEYKRVLAVCDGKREEARKQGNAAAEDCRGGGLLGVGGGGGAGGVVWGGASDRQRLFLCAERADCGAAGGAGAVRAGVGAPGGGAGGRGGRDVSAGGGGGGRSEE